jgi:hypothetical protein
MGIKACGGLLQQDIVKIGWIEAEALKNHYRLAPMVVLMIYDMEQGVRSRYGDAAESAHLLVVLQLFISQ